MSKSLQDICREARDRQGMTNQDVADNSNVPLSSVQNFSALWRGSSSSCWLSALV